MCDRLCGAFNSRVFLVIPNFCYRCFEELYDLWFGCFTVESCYHCLTLILVSMCLPGSSLVFSYFRPCQGFSFSIFVILSLICLYLSSSSSFIFTIVELIPWRCVQTESVIFCRNFSTFSSFSSCVTLSASIISFLKKQRLFTWSRQFAFAYFSQLPFCSLHLLLIQVCPSARSFPFFPAVSGTFQS